jgi:hypothetical protein
MPRPTSNLESDTTPKASAPASGSVKIELRYNGDYPGYACIRINDRWATDKEEAALVTIFGARGLKHLYDIAGAERSHEEHKPWEGTLSFSQNDSDQERERKTL